MASQKIIVRDSALYPKQPNLLDYNKTNISFSWKDAEKEIDFFSDGTLNIGYNLVDRHCQTGKKDKTAIVFEGAKGEKETYTYNDLLRETNKFANVLENHGVKKGERIFIFLPTIPERTIVFIGILKMGAIAGTMFSAFQEMALLDRLLDSEAKIVITNATLFPRIKAIWKDLPKLEKVIIVERGHGEQPQGDNIIYYNHEMEKVTDDFTCVHMKKEDFSYMLYTSGTTGKPKGVVHAHGDIVQALYTTKYVLDVQDDDIYWCTADLGWVTGVVYGVFGPFALGATSVMFEGRFSPENWYTVLQNVRVTNWYTAPTAIRMLMGSKVLPSDYNLSSLRYLASVGEPLNPEGVWWGLEAFGLPFHDTWWQTELGSICITNFPVLDIKPGSMGKPVPGVVAGVVDENGKEVPDGKEGNLALRPESVYSMMKQIWNNQEKYNSYFSHGWYVSGDKAFKDKDGYFWFVGRADDVIKTSGERVGPFEVESALVAYPDIIEAGVIGKPDALRGEIIKAFIVLKRGVEPSDELKEQITQFVKKHLAGHAYPREIEFTDRLPKTRSGKIMRRLLKARELGLPTGDTSTLEDY